jgi:hypothetical protein
LAFRLWKTILLALRSTVPPVMVTRRSPAPLDLVTEGISGRNRHALVAPCPHCANNDHFGDVAFWPIADMFSRFCDVCF